MPRLTSSRARLGLALVGVVGCARSELYTAEWIESDVGGTGSNGGNGQGGTSAGRGGSSGTAAFGGVSMRGGSGGTFEGGSAGSAGRARGGTAGTVLHDGGSAGRVGGTGGTGGTGGASGVGTAGGSGGSGGSAGKPALTHCRDGVLDPGEECDAGEGPYSPPAIELRANGIVVELSPVIGNEDVNSFYGYSNESSHTGNENISGSKIYFYRPYFELGAYLITHHGIDFEATGFVQPDAKVHFEISGLPTSSYVVVADDADEVTKVSTTAVSAHWEFSLSSDGLVLGGIPFPGNWHILIEPEFIQGIDTFTSLSGDGYRTGLSLARSVELIASDVPGACRRDCTIPRCGDGRVDAGETCDDGNDTPSDGCTKCAADGLPTPQR